jgi:hypothetical protein
MDKFDYRAFYRGIIKKWSEAILEGRSPANYYQTFIEKA